LLTSNKEVMAAAKGAGYERKVLRKVISLRQARKDDNSPKKKRVLENVQRPRWAMV